MFDDPQPGKVYDIPLTPQQIAGQDWASIQRQQNLQQMQSISTSLTTMHVILATGIANGSFPDEFRNYVKQSLLQIAATVEVVNE